MNTTDVGGRTADSLGDLVTYIASSIVDDPTQVQVDHIVGESTIMFELSVAPGDVGRDERGQDRHAVASQQLGDKGHALDVGIAVLGARAQVLGQALAHDVAVEPFDLEAPRAQLGQQFLGQRGFARARESGHPKSESFLFRHSIFSSLGYLDESW